MLLLQDTYDLILCASCYPPCCNSFRYWGLPILVLNSSIFWASATSLHFGWHAHPGNGSAGKFNHTTTSTETCADCLKFVLGLTESMGEAVRCAAHKAPASQAPVATQTGKCAAHKAPASQAPVATNTGQNCWTKDRTLKLGKKTVTHNSNQTDN